MVVGLDSYLVCTSLVIIIGYVLYYLTDAVKEPIVSVSNGPFKNFLLDNVPTISKKFWPTIWCVESRVQTAFSSIYRSILLSKINYRREIFILKDGGEVGLDWMDDGCKLNSPIILIFPGLTGGSQENYARILVLAAKKHGIRTLVFNNRGIGGVELKTNRLYNAANCEDIAEIIIYVKQSNPNVSLGAVGISMGGLVLGHFLADYSQLASDIFTSCCFYSVPFNVPKASENICKPVFNKMISKYLAGYLVQIVSETPLFKSSNNLNFNQIKKSQTIKEFDSSFTTIHFGFDDVEHYYRSATLHNKLNKISVPLLCLNAADDPFQPMEVIPMKNARESTHVAIAVTARGGHIGFLDRFLPDPNDQYMARIFIEYFQSSLLVKYDQFKEISVEMMKRHETYNNNTIVS